MKELSFLTPDAKQAFIQLKQAFTKALILQYFDPEHRIWIDTYNFGYDIGSVFSQMISEMGQWYPIAYYSEKIIWTKTRYETHDTELLVTLEVFRNWRHYLERCRYKVLLLSDHNNLRRFMNTKNSS